MSKKALICFNFLAIAVLLISCQVPAGSSEPSPTARETTSIPATLTASVEPPTPTLPAVPSPVIDSNPASGELYEMVLSLPAGKTGFPYRGADTPGMLITGPNAIALLSDGRFVIADLIDNRVWILSPTGEQSLFIDLYPLGILNVADLRVYEDQLYILEIYLGPPVHYRINILSSEGKPLTVYEISEGYHLENGLTGFTVDCNGKIFLEMAGQLKPLPLSNETLIASSTAEQYQCNGKSFTPQTVKPGEKPRFIAGDFTLETSLTMGLGGLSLLKVLPDGSFFVVRSDVVNFQVIQVDDTVHYFSAEGLQLGVARVPVDERYYYVMRNLAVGPDGNVYCLLPKPDSLKILRLKFYPALEPLLPGAESPTVTSNAPSATQGS